MENWEKNAYLTSWKIHVYKIDTYDAPSTIAYLLTL